MSSPPSLWSINSFAKIPLSTEQTKRWLQQTRYATPLLLFFTFLALFLYQSITEAKKLPRPLKGQKKLKRTSKTITPAATPPLGQPRSASSRSHSGRKILFLIADAVILLTYLGNAYVVASHALADRDGEYWCGEAFVVGSCLLLPMELISMLILL